MEFDVAVVGSGFGGSVAALRLSEKGYRVVVLEAGRRFTAETLPRGSWDVRRFLWAPRWGCYGVQRIHLLRNVLVLAGAGVGGGSLNYANTLYVPPASFFADPQWGGITDWAAELNPFYDLARRMLGVRVNPTVTDADVHVRAMAERLGVGRSFRLTPVGVFFGDGRDGDGVLAAPGEEAADPYFGGVGPRRRACRECGECMTGCRHGAKNMLTENYLYLAERAGAVIRPMTTVTGLREVEGGYAVATRRTDRRRVRGELRVSRVVVAAGAYGTQSLLHACRDAGTLPRISGRLGELTRTNSESLAGAMTTDRRYGRRVDFTRGVAITSSVHLDEVTHVEPVRYGRGSNAMGLLATIQVPGGGRWPRWSRFVWAAVRRPGVFLRSLSVRRWSERTIICLVMQSRDNSLSTFRRWGRLTSRAGRSSNPTWIPGAQEAVRVLADEIGGFPGGSVAEVLDVPMTAHFLGGCPIGADAEAGVVDPYHRLWGHPGVSVADGAAVPANLGVNPSLTITALAERAFAGWPNAGEPDPRPAQGEPYVRVAGVAPVSPVVPEGAFAALR